MNCKMCGAGPKSLEVTSEKGPGEPGAIELDVKCSKCGGHYKQEIFGEGEVIQAFTFESGEGETNVIFPLDKFVEMKKKAELFDSNLLVINQFAIVDGKHYWRGDELEEMKEQAEKLEDVKEWYEQHKKEPIPYQRTPTKWDKLGRILGG